MWHHTMHVLPWICLAYALDSSVKSIVQGTLPWICLGLVLLMPWICLQRRNISSFRENTGARLSCLDWHSSGTPWHG